MSDKKISLKTIVDFCRRKGFVYPSSEIYGGFAATYDFGPLGLLLKKNIEKTWRDWMVTFRTDTVEIEGAIFMHPKVWEASGHVGGFADVLVEDIETHKRYRADHLLEECLPKILEKGDWKSKEMDSKVIEIIESISQNLGALNEVQFDSLIKYFEIKSPDGNLLSKAKKFNLLVKTHLGPVEDATSIAYLKGESCQNIYVDWKLVQETTTRKIPFGICQMGKAFRNEITVKQYMFRTRELEQLDVQFFIKPPEYLQSDDKNPEEWYKYWKDYTFDFYNQGLGLSKGNLKWRQHDEKEMAFYAKDAWDIDYQFGELGFKEMGGLHHRGSYDLDQHSKFSGQDLTYFDPILNQRYNPWIIESSLGFGRMFLATLFEHYHEELISDNDSRVVLKLPLNLCPYKYAILPLMKKDGLGEKAFEIYTNLRKVGINCDFSDTGSIGKRYRRQDESGTMYCVCVDYETLEDGTVTIRDRDTMEQKRVKIEEIK
jgi:glycyl-tRNA synthetase